MLIESWGAVMFLNLRVDVLVPQVESARRFKVDLTPYPHIQGVDQACGRLSAFQKAAPAAQPDAA